jgi:uncharacterized protein (TIGR02145 family)
MNHYKRNYLMMLLVICTLGCKKASFEHVVVNDKSNTFIIGEQIWMNENLHITRFNNGDSIPQAQSAKEWENAGKNKQPAWCYSDSGSNEIFYNWYVINDSRGIIPDGWHLPSYEEIQYVMKIHHVLNTLVSEDYDYGNAFASYPSSRHEREFQCNTTYFIPLTYAGNRFGNGKFKGIEKIGVFWTSQEPEKGRGYIPVYAQLSDEKELYMVSSNPANGVAIRLIKNH